MTRETGGPLAGPPTTVRLSDSGPRCVRFCPEMSSSRQQAPPCHRRHAAGGGGAVFAPVKARIAGTMPSTVTPALPIAVVDDRRFDQHRSNELHPERPERLIAARAGLTSTLPTAEQTEVLVRAVSDEEAERVHSSDYLARLQRTLRTGWGHIDADTYFCPKTGEAAWLAAGGGVELSRALLEGRARR